MYKINIIVVITMDGANVLLAGPRILQFTQANLSTFCTSGRTKTVSNGIRVTNLRNANFFFLKKGILTKFVYKR